MKLFSLLFCVGMLFLAASARGYSYYVVNCLKNETIKVEMIGGNLLGGLGGCSNASTTLKAGQTSGQLSTVYTSTPIGCCANYLNVSSGSSTPSMFPLFYAASVSQRVSLDPRAFCKATFHPLTIYINKDSKGKFVASWVPCA